MPRYYFDLVDDSRMYDKKGVSLSDIDAAKSFAATFARELAETTPTLLGESLNAWSIRISDGKFKKLLEIPLTELVNGSIASLPGERA